MADYYEESSQIDYYGNRNEEYGTSYIKQEEEYSQDNDCSNSLNYNKRSFDDPQANYGDGERGPAKRMKRHDGIEMRCLVPSRAAGGIIGKGGCNIKDLRDSLQIQVYLPDATAPERVLKVKGNPQKCGEVILRVLPQIDEVTNGKQQNEQSDDQNYGASIKLLVHQSQAGGIIGTKGVKIKELREQTGATIKVHQDCAGMSTDRIVIVSGSHDVISSCIVMIMELLESIPPKGPIEEYDPQLEADYGYDDYYGDDYGFGGGYGYGGGFGGGFRGQRGFRGGPRGRGGFGGPHVRGRFRGPPPMMGFRGGRGRAGFRGGRGFGRGTRGMHGHENSNFEN